MSLVPSQSGAEHTSAQKRELEPSRPVDPPNFFWRFIDGLRKTVGIRSLELADRWAEAKVSGKEIDNEIRRGMAIASVEKSMAEVRKMDWESESQHAFKVAETRRMHALARQEEIKADLMETTLHQLENRVITPQEATANVLEIQRNIELRGGTVEYRLPVPPSNKSQQSNE